jgi:cation diffusion facilitator family transporter
MTAEVNYHDESSDRKARNSVALLSVLTAAFLILLKAGAGWLTGSVSVLASLLDSTMDIFASTINYIAVRAASKPADEDHAYGHGKAESLAGLFQAVVIGISGVFLIAEAVRRLVKPQPTSSEWIGVATMLIAMAASAALVFRLRRVAAQTDSTALAADALHYATDIYINAGVLAALVLSALTGWSYADPIISIAIAIYILWSAFQVARDSINALMDQRLPPETEEQIADIISRFRSEGVLGFHDLRTRRSGPGRFVDLHLEIDRTKSFQEAHDVAVKVLRAIERDLPRTKVHVHSDPAG